MVNFIVESVDFVLKDEFKLEGLIDESKVTIKVDNFNNKNKKRERLPPTKFKYLTQLQEQEHF